MNYMDGKKVQLGGTFDLRGALTGAVVAVIEEGAGPTSWCRRAGGILRQAHCCIRRASVWSAIWIQT